MVKVWLQARVVHIVKVENPASFWPEQFPRPGSLPDDLVTELAGEHRLSFPVASYLCQLYSPLAAHLAQRARAQGSPLMLGVNGAQATGKSTAAAILVRLLEHQEGLRSCSLSIDDVYLTRAEREQLARRVHPLLLTRGVPGTHDLALTRQLFADLCAAGPDSQTPIPRFDKAADDRRPPEAFDVFSGRPDLVIFEGWCLGAVPQDEADLAMPCNALEREQDADGVWRRHVNQCLADYQSLFARLDLLLMLRAPSFEQIFEWRSLQESKLRNSLTPEQLASSRVMSDKQLRHFISHYERLTRWILQELPERADIVLQLNPQHRVDKILCHSV